MSDIEREAFEKWHESKHGYNPEFLYREEYGKYMDPGVNQKWEGWQSARQASGEVEPVKWCKDRGHQAWFLRSGEQCSCADKFEYHTRLYTHPPAKGPAEPTKEMIEAAMSERDKQYPANAKRYLRYVWEKMLSAISTPAATPRPAQQWSVQEPFGTDSAYTIAKESGKGNMAISCELVVELVEALRGATEKTDDGWIKCADRDQPSMVSSICFSMGNTRDRGPHIRIRCPIIENCSDVTHWMPLPQPPVEQEDTPHHRSSEQ